MHTPLRRNTFIPAAYLILENAKGEILLLKRLNTGYRDGFYSFVAGHVEPQEMPSAAIIREAYEEAGIVLQPENVVLRHMMTLVPPGRIDYYFQATCWSGTVCNREPDKCSELIWCAPTSLPSNIIPHVRQALSFVQSHVPFAEQIGE
ncbi:MAG: NUDIX domain-containing protein [Holosporales bacterium]|jgi:8-oxo-dGTP pyrophosphatase MutT (NUDIX family)|nr:NUDIX domain-containing protein [Holosporales bacterium]